MSSGSGIGIMICFVRRCVLVYMLLNQNWCRSYINVLHAGMRRRASGGRLLHMR